jgi:hypothetical protein
MVDPPWRLDPFQNIVGVGWGKGGDYLAIKFELQASGGSGGIFPEVHFADLIFTDAPPDLFADHINIGDVVDSPGVDIETTPTPEMIAHIYLWCIPKVVVAIPSGPGLWGGTAAAGSKKTACLVMNVSKIEKDFSGHDFAFKINVPEVTIGNLVTPHDVYTVKAAPAFDTTWTVTYDSASTLVMTQGQITDAINVLDPPWPHLVVQGTLEDAELLRASFVFPDDYAVETVNSDAIEVPTWEWKITLASFVKGSRNFDAAFFASPGGGVDLKTSDALGSTIAREISVGLDTEGKITMTFFPAFGGEG